MSLNLPGANELLYVSKRDPVSTSYAYEFQSVPLANILQWVRHETLGERMNYRISK